MRPHAAIVSGSTSHELKRIIESFPRVVVNHLGMEDVCLLSQGMTTDVNSTTRCSHTLEHLIFGNGDGKETHDFCTAFQEEYTMT